jgi:ribonuclease BN (tRNA processing enzyme)
VIVNGKPRILVDAGPGSFVRLGEAKVPLDDLDIVLLTHLHVDHAGELPGLFKARAVSSRAPVQFRIFGPEGRHASGTDAEFPSTSRFISLLFGSHGAFSYLPDFAASLSFKTTDLPALPRPGATPAPKKILSEDDLQITAIPGHHRDAPSIIYRVDHAGRSLTFSGDIDPAGHAALRKIARGTSLLVFNSVVLDPPGSPPVLYTLHTAPRAIGQIAADAHAGRLLLSHISPAVEGQRAEVLASIAHGYTGPVEFATDGARLAP